MATLRQILRDRLKREPATAYGLAQEFETRIKEILDALAHLQKSRTEPLVIVKPSRCLDCGFTFKERSRLHSPSRCPKCKSEATTEPVIAIQ